MVRVPENVHCRRPLAWSYSDDGHYVWFLLPAYSADHLSAVVARGNSLNVRYGYSYVWLKCVKGNWRVVRTKYHDLT